MSAVRLGSWALAALLAAVVSFAPPANAADEGTYAIAPTPAAGVSGAARDAFDLQMAPGTTIRDSVTVYNLSDVPRDLVVYPADVDNSGPDGSLAPTSRNDPLEDVGAWITLGQLDIQLPPKTQANVPFTMVVPETASPGDHLGAIMLVDPADPTSEAGGGPTIQLEQAVGTRIYVRVDGPLVETLAITSVDIDRSGSTGWWRPDSLTLRYQVENVGNVLLSPTVDADFTGLFGRSLVTFPERTLADLLPGQSVTIEEVLQGPPPIDRVTATVVASWETGETAGDGVTWLIPWALLLALVLTGIFLAFWRHRRQQRRPAPEVVEDRTIRRGAHAARGRT